MRGRKFVKVLSITRFLGGTKKVPRSPYKRGKKGRDGGEGNEKKNIRDSHKLGHNEIMNRSQRGPTWPHRK